MGGVGGLVLCHGVCTLTGGRDRGKAFGHAWIENQNLVFDGEIGTAVDRSRYYAIGKVRDVRRFTLKQVCAEGLKRRHYGPWNPAITRAERWMEAKRKCAKK